MAEMPLCQWCGKTKRGHFKSNRYSMWFCNDGSGHIFRAAQPTQDDTRGSE